MNVMQFLFSDVWALKIIKHLFLFPNCVRFFQLLNIRLKCPTTEDAAALLSEYTDSYNLGDCTMDHPDCDSFKGKSNCDSSLFWS